MAESRTKRGSQKKRSSKTKTRFYIVETVQDARTRLTDKLEAYNRKYVAQPLETGKTFAEDLKAAPRKTVVSLVDDGKARMADLNRDTRTKLDSFAKDGQVFLTKAGKHPRKTFNELMDEVKELSEDRRNNTRDRFKGLLTELQDFKAGVEKDSRIVMADVLEGGNKALNHVPGKQRLEKEISSRLEALPAVFNLPRREDIVSLVKRVKQLNTKVEALNKAVALNKREKSGPEDLALGTLPPKEGIATN